MYASNPLVDHPNYYAGGEFHCKYVGKKYCIVGCLVSAWRGAAQLHLKNNEETLLVEAKYCHLIARSPNDLTDNEEMEIREDSTDVFLYFLLRGIYPSFDEDFKKGIVLDFRNFS